MDTKPTVEPRKSLKSASLKCGSKMFFFDIYLASNNKKFLKITESRFAKDEKNRKRNTFILFSKEVPTFQASLNALSGDLL